ncbi:MAG: HAMP domain-containing protein [Clostridiaceae bacterium]|nr:HAMP domain-containing protein [Clostridiaceae bacterium]
MDKLKLKWKIYISLLIFCGVLLLILWLFQTVFLNDMYKVIRRNELREAVRLVEKNIDSPDLDEVIYRLNSEKSIMVAPTRDFVAPRPPAPSGPRESRLETLTEIKEFKLANGRTLSLTFHAMITPVDATVSTLQMQLYIITGIMILAAVVIALVLSDRIAKPLVRLNERAKELSRGDYRADFAGSGYREVGELSDTLNTAAIELSKVEALRRELIANVSHDLRTPLALIYSHAEMMQDFPEEISAAQVQAIMSETRRLSALVDDLLDVSRLETGTMELRLCNYNLTDSINETVLCLAELLRNDGFTIVFEYAEDVYVTADEAKITQAVYNLLTNAVNHSTADRRIIVRQISLRDGAQYDERDGGVHSGERDTGRSKVRIEVIDHGEGIPPESLPRIWDRYFRADKKPDREVMGTGLGLSIVKKIFELHGAEYGVKTEPGKGSLFWFQLKRPEQPVLGGY